MPGKKPNSSFDRKTTAWWQESETMTGKTQTKYEESTSDQCGDSNKKEQINNTEKQGKEDTVHQEL